MYDGPEETGSGGEVVEEILVGGVILIDFGQEIFERRVEFVVAEVAGEIVEALGEPLPEIVFLAFAAVGLDVFMHALAEIFGRHRGAGHADYGEVAREQAGAGQVVESGNEHAAGEVAGGAEDDHDARVALLADARQRDCRLFR